MDIRPIQPSLILFSLLFIAPSQLLAEPALRYEDGLFLDSDRQLLFGRDHARRNISFHNLPQGNDVDVRLEWTVGPSREIFLRIYDESDRVLGSNTRISNHATQVSLAGLPANKTFRIEAIARTGNFAVGDRITLLLTSRLPQAIAFVGLPQPPDVPDRPTPETLVDASEILARRTEHPVIAPLLAEAYRGRRLRIRTLENGQLSVGVPDIPPSLRTVFPGVPWERTTDRLEAYEFYLRDRGERGLAGYIRPRSASDPQSYPWVTFRRRPNEFVRLEVETR